MGMRDFALTIEEVRSLRALHHSCRDRRLADRIKAIVLLGTGWTVSDTAEALMLDEDTIHESAFGGPARWNQPIVEPALSGQQS
jgi:hypothetical protein